MTALAEELAVPHFVDANLVFPHLFGRELFPAVGTFDRASKKNHAHLCDPLGFERSDGGKEYPNKDVHFFEQGANGLAVTREASFRQEL